MLSDAFSTDFPTSKWINSVASSFVVQTWDNCTVKKTIESKIFMFQQIENKYVNKTEQVDPEEIKHWLYTNQIMYAFFWHYHCLKPFLLFILSLTCAYIRLKLSPLSETTVAFLLTFYTATKICRMLNNTMGKAATYFINKVLTKYYIDLI